MSAYRLLIACSSCIQVRFAVREYACTAVDVIARRLRISFLNVVAAEEALPRIIDIMTEELKWSKSEARKQHEEAVKFLRSQMGSQTGKLPQEPVDLTLEEIGKYTRQFQSLDKEGKGYIGVNDLRRSLKVSARCRAPAPLTYTLRPHGPDCASVAGTHDHRLRAARHAERGGHQQERSGGAGRIPGPDDFDQNWKRGF